MALLDDLDESILNKIKFNEIYAFIDELEAGLNTDIGDNGLKLTFIKEDQEIQEGIISIINKFKEDKIIILN